MEDKRNHSFMSQICINLLTLPVCDKINDKEGYNSYFWLWSNVHLTSSNSGQKLLRDLTVGGGTRAQDAINNNVELYIGPRKPPS